MKTFLNFSVFAGEDDEKGKSKRKVCDPNYPTLRAKQTE